MADESAGVLSTVSLSRALSVDPLFTAQLEYLHDGGDLNASLCAGGWHRLPRAEGNE
jgi:hypothetical protein